MDVLWEDLCQRIHKIFVSWPQLGKSCKDLSSKGCYKRGQGSLEAYKKVADSFPWIQLCPGNEGGSIWSKHQVLRRERETIQQVVFSSFLYLLPVTNKQIRPSWCFKVLLYWPHWKSVTVVLWQHYCQSAVDEDREEGLGLCGGVKSQSSTTSNYGTWTNYLHSEPRRH